MNKIKDGGPAFPLPVGDQECCPRFESGYGGMSLRDYFAAKAMQAYMAAHLAAGTYDESAEFDREVSAWSYETADAMLEARKS